MHPFHQILLILSLLFAVPRVEAQMGPIAQVIHETYSPALTVQTPLSEPIAGYQLDATTTILLHMTNAARATPLQENQQLMKAAWYRAQYFCSHAIEHTSPDGTNAWEFFGLADYNYKDAGENIAVGYSNPVSMQLAFMKSPEHYANIIKPTYTDIGLADQCGHVVVLFGNR